MKAILATIAGMLCVATPTLAENKFNPSINIDIQTTLRLAFIAKLHLLSWKSK